MPSAQDGKVSRAGPRAYRSSRLCSGPRGLSAPRADKGEIWERSQDWGGSHPHPGGLSEQKLKGQPCSWGHLPIVGVLHCALTRSQGHRPREGLSSEGAEQCQLWRTPAPCPGTWPRARTKRRQLEQRTSDAVTCAPNRLGSR